MKMPAKYIKRDCWKPSQKQAIAQQQVTSPMKAQGTHTKGPQRKMSLLPLQFHPLNQPLPPSYKPPNIKEFSGPLQHRRHKRTRNQASLRGHMLDGLGYACHMSKFCDESAVESSSRRTWTSLSLAMFITLALALTWTFYQGAFIIGQHLYGNEREAGQCINGDI
jgi:hypothetical protein